MVNLNKQKKQMKDCFWCSSVNELYLGPGKFRDFDSDFSYGIPICGGCGGFGKQINTNEFKKTAKRILKLRFEYCPMDSDYVPVPVSIKLQKLEAIVSEATALWKKYKLPNWDCYAKEIVDGRLDPDINDLCEKRDDTIERIKNSALNYPGFEHTQSALITAYACKLKNAELIFRKGVHEHPDSANLFHDYGTFMMTFNRDYEQALPLLQKAHELRPEEYEMISKLVNCYFLLNKFPEALAAIKLLKENIKKTQCMKIAKDAMRSNADDVEKRVMDKMRLMKQTTNSKVEDKSPTYHLYELN